MDKLSTAIHTVDNMVRIVDRSLVVHIAILDVSN